VTPYDGDPWPFARQSEENGEPPPDEEDGVPEVDMEIASVLDDDAAAFARVLWRDFRHFRPGSLKAFTSFDEFLVRFGAFAAH
jgi:hypothetical protein